MPGRNRRTRAYGAGYHLLNGRDGQRRAAAVIANSKEQCVLRRKNETAVQVEDSATNGLDRERVVGSRSFFTIAELFAVCAAGLSLRRGTESRELDCGPFGQRRELFGHPCVVV